MNNHDAGFQDLESGIQSHNVSSGQLVDIDHNSPYGIKNLDPTLEFSQLQQLEALRIKRDIFDTSHKLALSMGHKVDITEEDCLINSISGKKSDPQNSISSLSCNLKNMQKPIGIKPTQNQSNKTIQYTQKLEHEDFIIASPIQYSGTNVLGIKSDAKILKYQTFVERLEKEQEQNENNKRITIHRDTHKQQSILSRGKSDIKTGLNEVWATKALIIIRLVSRFIQQLKQKTERIKFRLITKRIFEVICDNSANFEYMLINRLIKQKPSLGLVLFTKIQKKASIIFQVFEIVNEYFGKYVKVMKPDSLFKIIWDIVLLIFIIINIFYIPLNISFDVEPSGIFEWIFDLLPSWIFVAEILLNFNTAYYDKGLMHEDRKQIMKHYLKGTFFWDLVIVVPSLLTYMGIDVVVLKYFLLLRLTRLSSLMTGIEEVLNLEENIQVFVDLVKLAFFIVLTGHFCGCAWHWLAIIEYNNYNVDKTWLTSYEPDSMNFYWFDRYIMSLYWSVVTTVTVGYGDIIPVTTVERIFVIIVTLLICGIFGYCISNIGNIFKQITDKRAIYKSKIREINQHIRKRGLSYNLQLKVKKYFEYYLKVQSEEEQHAETFIDQLTKHLKSEVLTDIYCKTLKQSRFLRENFSIETLNRMCQVVKETKLLPEQILFQKNDAPKALWFVLSGAIEYIADHQNEDEHYQSTETYLKKITQGVVIGEREFISQTSYEYNARATKFTQLLELDYNQFYNIIRENQEEFEKFCLAKDSLLFNNQYKGFGQICEICGWTHRFIYCPFVFLQPNKNKIANSFTSSKYNNRLQFPYRTLPKTNFRNCVPDAQEAALAYIVHNNIIPEKEINSNKLIELGFELNDKDDETIQGIQLKNKRSSLSNQKDQILQQPLQQPSIQTVLQDQKSQNQTAIFLKDTQKNNSPNDSFLDWDQQSQLRRSMNRIKLQSFDRGRTLQSMKGKHGTKEGNEIQDESMIQEEVKIQSMNIGSQNFIHNKLKMVKSKHSVPHNNNNNNNGGLRKVSWLEFDNIGSHQEQKYQSPAQLFTKQQSKSSDLNADIPITIPTVQENEIKQRIEARENSLISKKLPNTSNDIQRRKKKRKTTQLLQFFQNPDSELKSAKRLNERSLLNNDVYSSSVNTVAGPSTSALYDSNGKQEYQDNNNNNNNSLIVAQTNDEIQKIIQDIVHTRIELDLDIAKSSTFYFPEFNLEIVIQKIISHYEKINEKQMEFDMREMKRTKTNFTLFDRIRQMKNTTIRGSFVDRGDKSVQDD